MAGEDKTDKNEYDQYFSDDVPVAVKPARKPVAVASATADVAPADAAPAASVDSGNVYDDYFKTSPEEEAARLASEAKNKQDQAAKAAAERELQQNIKLRVVAGGAGAGALFGASRTPDYRQAFVDLASEVYGASPESVEKFLMKKYPQPDTSAQIAKGVADEELMAREEKAAAAAKSAAATAKNAAAVSGVDVPTVDEHGTVRWINPRVAPAYAPPTNLTNKIVTLTGGANVPGSGENILAENADTVRKLTGMGHDVGSMPKAGNLPAKDQILLAEGYRTRPTPPDVPTWSSGRGIVNYQLPQQPLDPVAQLGRARPQVDMVAGAPTPVAATQAPARAPAVAPAAAAAAAVGLDDPSYAKDLAKRIEKAGGLAAVLSRGAKAGLYGGATAMSGLDLWHAINSMMQNGINPENTAQGVEGAGFLAALKYPRLGLGVSGGAKAERAGESMADTGVTPENAAKMASGLGIAAMPYGRPGAVAGAALQAPEAILAVKQWLLDHPEFGQQLQKGSQTYGQSRFGLD